VTVAEEMRRFAGKRLFSNRALLDLAAGVAAQWERSTELPVVKKWVDIF
jgi:hypothetical protein